MKIKFDKDLIDDQLLWRYMDLSKFISMLEKQAIWLARADRVKDKHEGRFPDEMKRVMEKFYKNPSPDDKSPITTVDDFYDRLIKNTFISCWHKNFDENMVMWEVYGKVNNSIAIQTTVCELKKCMIRSKLQGHSFILKNVEYKQSNETSGELPYEDCFFIKRPHFEFEKEVRISLDTYAPLAEAKKTAIGQSLFINTNDLIKKILIHPDSEDWFLDAVNSIAKKYDIKVPIFRGSYGNNYTKGESNG